MASNNTQFIVKIDGEYLTNDVKQEVERLWSETKTLAQAKLVIPQQADESDSKATKLFSSEKFKSILSKVSSSKFWTLAPIKQTLEPLSLYPLVPILLTTSKVYMALFPNQECSATENSFELIKNIQHAYEEVLKVSQADKNQKNEIGKQLKSVLSDTIIFTTNTLARLFVRSSESDLFLDMFMRENYYTSINIIRVFEFSILDLFMLEERYQSPLVTPLETHLEKWKSSASYNSEFVEANFRQSLLASYNSTYGFKLGDGESSDNTWPTQSVIKSHFEFTRNAVNDQLFNCGNHESCSNRETKPRTFARCSNCKWMRYCSRSCQINHWKTKHKQECGKPLTEEDSEALFRGRRIIIGAEADVAAPPASSSS